MSHVVEPLFVEWQRFAAFHRSGVMLAHLRNNRVAWQRKKQMSSATSSEPSNHSSSSSKSRRHSLPTARDVASRSCDRRHSAPHAAVPLSMGGLTQLAELNECSPSSAQSDGHFQFGAEPQTPSDRRTSSPASACLDYLASLADRRLSLNTCSAHARRKLTTSRMRSRSLVTPSCHPGNGVASGHLLELGVKSSSSRDALPIRRTTGRLHTVRSGNYQITALMPRCEPLLSP